MGILHDVWDAIHISEHGKYSPERWQALQQYQQRTSVARALGVCLLTPLPSLVLVIIVEALPLAPISDGWHIISMLSLRLIVGAMVMAFCLLNLSRRFIPELKVTPRELIFPAIITAVVHTSFMYGYAALWVFPLPFAIAQTSGIFTGFCVVSFILCLGTAPFRGIPDIVTKIKVYLMLLTILTVISMAYPAYGAFYRSQHGLLQVIIIALPRVAKLIAKPMVAKLVRVLGREEFIPETVHCSLELLHTLFISSCVQTTTQPLQIALVILVFDFLPLANAYRQISSTSRAKGPPRSEASLARVYPTSSSRRSEPLSKCTSSNGRLRRSSRSQRGSFSSKARTRRALYMCENHLLVEYLECVIPVTYAIYVVALYYLPNAQFYETMQSMHTSARPVQYLSTSAIFVALQSLSVVVFGMMMSRRVLPSISSLHQLSFVLETQAEMVQMWFFTWMPLCVLSPVAHGGMDFTLRFDWIMKNHAIEHA